MKVTETKFTIGDRAYLCYQAYSTDFNTSEDVENFIDGEYIEIAKIVVKIANDECECYEGYISTSGRKYDADELWSESEVRKYASEHFGE